jgi:hypothetical protein
MGLGLVAGGTRLLAGDLDVKGVTDDDVTAVLDQSRGALAVPLAGGDPQVVDPAAELVFARGNAIFAFHDVDFVSGFGDVVVWTAAGGAVPLVTASTAVLAVSDDGARVLATQGSSSDGTMTNLVVAGVDGSAPVAVMPASRTDGCASRAVFAGGRFVVSHCAPGSTTVAVSAIDAATGAAVTLLDAARNQVAAVPGGSGLVALIASNGDASLFPADGGAPTPLGSAIDAVVPLPDGTAVLVWGATGVGRVPLDGSPPVQLLDQGVAAIRAVSSDGATVLFRMNAGPRNDYGDLFAMSARAPAGVTALSAALDTTTFGDAFTADDSRALYVTEADNLFVGTLRSQPAGGGAVAEHGRGVWITRAYAGTRAVFTSDYVPFPERAGLAMLRAADTADATATATVIASPVGADFALTKARDRVVFSLQDGGDLAGLYVAPLPGL